MPKISASLTWKTTGTDDEDGLLAIATAVRAKEFDRRMTLARPADWRAVERATGGPAAPHVVYLMNRVDVGGGSRIILEHANRLSARGVRVTIVAHYPKPAWYDVRCDYVQVPFGAELTDGIPMCDVIVATYWDAIGACKETGIAPVVHFEQGDFHLFEEIDEARTFNVSRQIGAADFTLTIASRVKQILAERYGATASTIPNAVDRSVFRPATSDEPRPERPYMLIVGSEVTKFKGIAELIDVHRNLRLRGHDLDLVWVTPNEPRRRAGRVVVDPKQSELAQLYRHAAVYVCGSHYESFPLPPLEAMASGCPVVSTDNVGILEYAVDGENSLIAPIGDVSALTNQVERVLRDRDLNASLVGGGLATADRYDWDAIMTTLEAYLRDCARYEAPEVTPLYEWELLLPAGCFQADDAWDRLAARLAVTGADAVAVPIVFEGFDGFDVGRWQVAARRRGTEPRDAVKVYLPYRSDRPGLPYATAYTAYRRGNHAEALTAFVDVFNQCDDWYERAALGRWIASSLRKLGRTADATRVIEDGISSYEPYVDYDLLHTRGDESPYTASKARLLGEAAQFPEFVHGVGAATVLTASVR